jgi:haloalkane dehalogenase
MIPNRVDHPNAKYIDRIRRELETWDIPVTVIWPDGDMAWKPDEGARIAQMVPDGEFYMVRNAGHFVQEDAGEEVAARLIRFLDKRIKPRMAQQTVTV